MSFKDIAFVDSYDNALFAQAKFEGLMETGNFMRTQNLRRNRISVQNVLSLLAIYERIYTVEYFSPGQEEEWVRPSIPYLKDEGVLESLFSLPEFARAIAGRGANYYQNRDPKIFLEALDNVIEFLPFILDRLVRIEEPFVDKITSSGIISKKKFLEEIIRYARAFYAGDELGLKMNVLHYLGDDFVSMVHADLKRQKPKKNLNAIDSVLFGAFFEFEKFNTYRLLSSKISGPVAGAKLSSSIATRLSLKDALKTAEASASAMAVMKLAFENEGLFFPYVEGIKHALKLRHNPHIKPFREKLQELNKILTMNTPEDIRLVCDEIKKANALLEKKQIWGHRLKWLTYFSLPAGLLESALWAVPLVGTSLAVTSVIGTKLTDTWEKGSNWILVAK